MLRRYSERARDRRIEEHHYPVGKRDHRGLRPQVIRSRHTQQKHQLGVADWIARPMRDMRAYQVGEIVTHYGD